MSGNIAWYNHHGPYNTGLPDYWLLVVNAGENLRNWGFPYFAEGPCPVCGERSVVSCMSLPNGGQELKYNCPTCGVLEPTRRSAWSLPDVHRRDGQAT